MSDTEPKIASKGAATGAVWTDTERVRHLILRTSLLLTVAQMAYLIVIAEHALDAPIESKISVSILLSHLFTSLQYQLTHLPASPGPRRPQRQRVPQDHQEAKGEA